MEFAFECRQHFRFAIERIAQDGIERGPQRAACGCGAPDGSDGYHIVEGCRQGYVQMSMWRVREGFRNACKTPGNQSIIASPCEPKRRREGTSVGLVWDATD